MCTDICPCYYGDDDENFDAFNDALSEDDLNEFGRTWDDTGNSYYYGDDYIPMVFSYEDISFSSLQECTEWWYELDNDGDDPIGLSDED